MTLKGVGLGATPSPSRTGSGSDRTSGSEHVTSVSYPGADTMKWMCAGR